MASNAVPNIPRRVREHQRLEKYLAAVENGQLDSSAWSYGNELLLEFRCAGGDKATLSTRASRWVLLSPTGIAARDGDARDNALEAFSAARGATVASASVRIEDYALTLAFSNGYRFVVLTTRPRATKLVDLALWELLLREEVVYVQPNGYVDVVPGELTETEAYERGLLHIRLRVE